MSLALKACKGLLKWGSLALLAFVLFFLLLEIFYPISLAKKRDLSRVVLDREGKWVYTTLNSNQQWRFGVDVKKLDPLYLQMLLNFEDKRFYHHFGVDPLALFRATLQLAVNGHITSGGSTITMQLARLLEPKERTVASKITEIFRALQLELHYSKEEILQAYLTLAPYGGNVEGVVAASMRYFGKKPFALTPAQSAMLVALPQSPEHNRPSRDPKAAKAARDKVLKRSLDAKIITLQAYKEALQEPVTKQTFRYPRFAPHLCQRLLKKSKESKIKTTLSLPLQEAIEKWARLSGATLPKDATLAVVVAKNTTGEVVSYLGSYDIFNRYNSGYIDMLRAVRSPGSALKPFIYAIALEQHIIDTNTIIKDKEILIGNYHPHNFTKKYIGDVTIAAALQNSLNIPAVKVLQAIGAPLFIERLEMACGKIVIPKNRATLPVALGGLGITPLQVAQAYTLLANGGSGYGLHILKNSKREPRGFTTLEAAQKVTNILREMQPPKGYTNRQGAIAYKTGTSYGYRDFWSAIYTKGYTAVVWVGKANNQPLFKSSARKVAAPFAFDIIKTVQSLLPHQNWSHSAEQTTTLTPPPLLQYFDKKDKEDTQSFDFLYPKEASRFQSASCQDVTVAVALKGGKAPYAWYVDGKPTKIEGIRTTFKLSAGAHMLSVIDTKGVQRVRNIWVNAPECEE